MHFPGEENQKSTPSVATAGAALRLPGTHPAPHIAPAGSAPDHTVDDPASNDAPATDSTARRDASARDTMPHDTAAAAAETTPVIPPQARRAPRAPHGQEAWRPRPEMVIAIRGADRADLAVTLDTIALTAARLPESEFPGFARELTVALNRPGMPVRAALLASDPDQLAERARTAAAALRTAGAPPVRIWPRPGTGMTGSGIFLSEAVRGRVALLFPGLAGTAVEHSAVLSASMATLAVAERIGVRPSLGVGYSFGEIAGLAWAGAITFGEVAKFAAHRAEIISAARGDRGAMARVFADPVTVARLREGTGLVIAARESPAQHVLAGPAADIRDLPQRGAAIGANVEVMSVAHALHSPAMLPSVPPMRSAANGLRFTMPRRRLVSTVTGLDVTEGTDIAELIAGQLARPAMLADALALACASADAVLMTARDPALARAAGADGRLPVIQAPVDPRSGYAASARAAFFTAGVADDPGSFLSPHAGENPESFGIK